MFNPTHLLSSACSLVARWAHFTPAFLLLLASSAGGLVLSARAEDRVEISEFLANNNGPLLDEDGAKSDWIELHNAGTNAVNLDGWYLTDLATLKTEWRIPAVMLPVNGYLLVFASGKDRQNPAGQLHTNFKLSNGGEYLALIKPDGVTVASEYAPAFPPQVVGISYGIPLTQIFTTLVPTGSAAKLLIPSDDSLAASWTTPLFNDTSWQNVTTGVGYETDPAPVITAVTLADSVKEFTGVQGQSNWYYGYWSKTLDGDGVYVDSEFLPFAQAVYRSATVGWDVALNVAPFTQIWKDGMRPNGMNSGEVVWPVRRWLSETNGYIRIAGTLAHNGACGDGTVAHIFVDGVEVFSRPIRQLSTGYSIKAAVSLGSRVDFAVEPGAAGDDGCDTTTFTAIIQTADPQLEVVADTINDWSLTGTQGERNWFYGYYNRTALPTYAITNFVPFPHDNGAPSAQNFWTGVDWDWFNGNPPWDQLGQIFCHPNGVNNGQEHWVIRRWVSKVSGNVTVDWHLAKQNPAGTGVTGYVFHKGTQKDTVSLTGTDTNGATRAILLTGVQIGDFIELMLAPGLDDGSDGSFLNATIWGTANLSNSITSNIELAMRNVNPGAYLRIPFAVADPSTFSTLTLRMKYDDGFVAYLNGTAVADRNAPVSPVFNSTALGPRSDADANQFEDIDLSSVLGLLQPGNNVLAIQGLNASAGDSDFVILPELRASSFVGDPTAPRYFVTPTPGAINGFGNTNLGPLVVDAQHTPNVPKDDEDLLVTASLQKTFNPIGDVQLTYRVMFNTETNVPMFDDGLHGDGAAGDGVYGATIPASAAKPGQMVRWFITASDTHANRTRFPEFADPLNSPQYLGTIVDNPALTNPLPVLHWFFRGVNAVSDINTAGIQCSMFYDGEFYDNIFANLHGQSSSGSDFLKHSFNVNMTAGNKFRWWTPDTLTQFPWPGEGNVRVGAINLLTTYPDKSHMRNLLAYGTYSDTDSPHHYVVPVRVQTNGTFWGDAHIVENGDNDFLKRLGRNPNNALYKMYNSFDSTGATTIGSGAAEKKTRQSEGSADLLALYNGVSLTGNARTLYMYDNVDVAETINFLAVRALTGDVDCCHKNYYIYRDSEGSGEWSMIPWDVDLSFGRVWSSAKTYWDELMHPDTGIPVGGGNHFVDAILNTPATRQMYMRRMRTIMDTQLQAPGTLPGLLKYERRIDELLSLIGPDAAEDFAKWPQWGNGMSPSTCCTQTMTQASLILKQEYLPARRNYMFTNQVTPRGEVPLAQPAGATLVFGAIDYNPSSANQAEEYIELKNTNTYAVDISGWKLSGAITYTFKGGTAIATNQSLFVSPNVRAFRARATGPRGNQGLFVQGAYQGQLSARGETVYLIDNHGATNAVVTYPGTPSLAQQYLRVTEIMYHPAAPTAGSPYLTEDFEYLELKNIGPAALDLAGVHFTNGIDFTFTGGSLAAGQSVLLVRNQTAFESRYGSGLNVAGQYAGSLANAGENVRLDDAAHEKVLDFSYNNAWYPITDGFGFSLVIVDETASWDTWGFKANWRPSGTVFGSPGQTEPPPTPIANVVINELLAHSAFPLFDMVELFNPGPGVADVSGWFLTDDFQTPKKYRFPTNSLIPAGGFFVVNETSFTNGPTGFAFSARGDEVYLFSGDSQTNLTGYFHGYKFGASPDGVSFGRYLTSIGEEHFILQTQRTLNATNAGPLVGPVVISEIMYHPPDFAGGNDNSLAEYLELQNITGATVSLFDTVYPTNTWHLAGDISFRFRTNVTLTANSRLLLVNFDPATNAAALAAFHAAYNVPMDATLFGPYGGKLGNNSGKIELLRPDVPDLGFVPYILVDEVDFKDSAPWPSLADGFGPSLHRVNPQAYGNDSVNWIAAAPSVALADAGGTAPMITGHPAGLLGVAFNPATFSVTATGSEPLSYQWRYNDQNLPGETAATLVLPNLQLSQAGSYSVTVFNSAGAVTSSNAFLSVNFPATILQQPVGRIITISASNNFTVTAVGTGKLRYQWRFNGGNILNATNPSLSIVSAAPADDGNYDVIITDDVGAVASAVARLTVLSHPILTLQPTNATVIFKASGVNVTLLSLATSATPVRYQWQFNGTNIANGTNANLIITNVQTFNVGDYNVVATDNYGSVSSTNATLKILFPPAFTLQPQNITAVAGDAVTFTAAVTGTPPFGYKWRRNGAALVNNATTFGVTTPTLTLLNVQAGQAGNYTVVVTNLASGGVVSANGVLTVLTDADGDHMPDDWEIANGFNKDDPADGALDFDGDGFTNLQEYIAGTDPHDPTSYLKIDSFIGPPGTTTLTFIAQSNKTYTVQFKDSLGADWQRLTHVLVRPTNRVETITDSAPASANRFYQLVTPLQP